MKFCRLALILFFLTFLCPGASTYNSQLVRVAVAVDAERIKIAIRSPYQILSLQTNEELSKGRGLWPSEILVTESGIKIAKEEFKIYGLRIQPKKSPSIYINERKFRGAIDIIRQSNKRLLAVNHLDVEEYIRGVLYHEAAPWWPMEALKTQAIVSRTFAIYQARVNSQKDYDVSSSVYSQVYGGRTSEKGRTSKAVRLTKDMVLTYKDKLFPTFYHATCAGHTEDASNLWKINLAPLRGRECQFCKRSPHFRWQRKIALKDIETALEKAGFKVGTIKSIQIIDRTVSGRITELEIISAQGRIRVSANRFRLACGPNLIRSANFTLKLKERQVYFEGSGWGHGVGMCQWGAFFMSRSGFNAQQILDYYYPDAKIKKIEEIKDTRGNVQTF